MLAASIAKDWILEAQLPEANNHALIAILSLGGAFSRRQRFHELLAPVMMAVVGAYIALLFARLQSA